MSVLELPETRLKFFLPRLAVSVLLIAAFWAFIRFYWYPGHYYALSGTPRLMLIVAAFVVLAGPVLTTMFYRRNKKGMWGDIAVLAVVELIALGIAFYAFYDRRPAFLVFAVDRFEIVAPVDVDTDLIEYAEFASGGIETLVAARLPDDPAVAEPIVDDILFSGGVDIDRRPSLWEPYEFSAREAAERARPLADLESIDSDGHLQDWLAGQDDPAFKFGFLPIRGAKADATLIINEQGYPVTILPIDPWLN